MLMTKETKEKLLLSTEENLERLTSELDVLYGQFLKIEKLQQFLEEKDSENTFGRYKGLINFRMIVAIIYLDLCSATLVYLRGKFQYEAINACRQIIAVINEGYKKIFNLVFEKDGNTVLKYRNNSFWIKEIGLIINNDLPNLKFRYDEITRELDGYLVVNFEDLKTKRDLSIHFDKEPSKVYKMLIVLDLEVTFRNLIPFIRIINNLFEFTNELSREYLILTENQKNKQEDRFGVMINQLESFKNNANQDNIEEIQQGITNLKNLFFRD